jgi:F-type H+-transporting ATPase subunit b
MRRGVISSAASAGSIGIQSVESETRMHQLLLAAAGEDPPIIDLDSTVFLQLAVFLVMAFLLNAFLFQPYLKVRAAREAGVEGAEDDAKEMEASAAAKSEQVEAAVARARTKANEERAKLRSDGLAREREIVSKAVGSAQGAVEQARKKLDADAGTARKELEPRARELGVQIATKILGREVA